MLPPLYCPQGLGLALPLTFSVCVYYPICLTLTVPLQILRRDTACAETNRPILTFR